MANQNNVPVCGRLAGDIRFQQGETVDADRAYGRVIDNVPDYESSVKDADGNVTKWAPRRPVGFDITFKGADAAYAAQNYRKGDPLLLVTNRPEWTRERDGKPYNNVTHYVTKHTFDVHTAGTVLSREKAQTEVSEPAQSVAGDADAEQSRVAGNAMSEGYANGPAAQEPIAPSMPMLHQTDGYPSHLARPDAYAPAQ